MEEHSDILTDRTGEEKTIGRRDGENRCLKCYLSFLCSSTTVYTFYTKCYKNH